jgi:hypothetical protein
MLYLYILRENKFPTQNQMNSILEAFRRSRGSEIRMLGGNKVDGSLPREPDMYVVMTCMMVCQKNNIPFDSNRDQIAYSVGFDTVENEKIGVCEIIIKK